MKSASGKAKKGKAGDKRSAEPQLKKDPAFMKRIESAVQGEFDKATRRAPKGVEPKPESRAAKPIVDAPLDDSRAREPEKTQRKRKPAGAERKALAAELAALAADLDAEGLAFLVEQAHVHLYNMRVRALEEEGAKLDESSRRSVAMAGSGTSAAAASRAGAFSIKAGEGGSDYHIVRDGKWKLFAADEMLAMVRIATVKEDIAEVGGRLYRWLKRERSDFFGDIPVTGPNDRELQNLVALIRKTFVVRE